MTTPAAHDHPDWARTVSSTDIMVFSGARVVGVGTTVYGRFFVGNLTHLQLSMSVSAGGTRLFALWYRDATSVIPIAVNRVDCRFPAPSYGALEVLGPYVSLEGTADAAGRTVSLDVWQARSGGQDTSQLWPTSLIGVDGVAIASGVTRTDTPLACRWGWAHFNVRVEDAASGRVRLLAVDYQANTTLLCYWGNGLGTLSTLLVLPPSPVRMESVQNDGVNRDLYAALNFHPGPL